MHYNLFSRICVQPYVDIINSAPIENKCLYEKNGSCKLCLKICPAKALSIDSFEKFDCQDEVNRNERIMKETTNLQLADTCGKCISICPVAYIE